MDTSRVDGVKAPQKTPDAAAARQDVAVGLPVHRLRAQRRGHEEHLTTTARLEAGPGRVGDFQLDERVLLRAHALSRRPIMIGAALRISHRVDVGSLPVGDAVTFF